MAACWALAGRPSEPTCANPGAFRDAVGPYARPEQIDAIMNPGWLMSSVPFDALAGATPRIHTPFYPFPVTAARPC